MTYKEKLLSTHDWKKRATIINLYHKMKSLSHRKWGVRQTAKYFEISIGAVSESIKIAENLDKIADCKYRQQALLRLK